MLWFFETYLLRILKTTNDNRLDKETSLKLDKLFISFVIWRHNLRYKFATSLFGYADHSGIHHID